MSAIDLVSKIERIKWNWLRRCLWPVYRFYKRKNMILEAMHNA